MKFHGAWAAAKGQMRRKRTKKKCQDQPHAGLADCSVPALLSVDSAEKQSAQENGLGGGFKDSLESGNEITAI